MLERIEAVPGVHLLVRSRKDVGTGRQWARFLTGGVPHVKVTVLQYTLAFLGYDDEDKGTVLELTYNYGVTEYDRGNAYAQVKS